MAEKIAEPKVTKTAATRTAFAVIANAFLDQSQREDCGETYKSHKRFLKSFAQRYGRVKFCDLTPFIFNRWTGQNPKWGDGSKRVATNVIKACLTWWCEQYNIPNHPLERLKAPPEKSRDAIITEADQERILDHLRRSDPFRDFFYALQQSGARPSEVQRVKPEHFDPEKGLWVMKGKTTRKTGKMRVIFLTPALVALCNQLVRENKDDREIFRNRDGRPWGKSAISYRFRKLAEELQIEGISSYLLRHSFVSLGLERGVGIAQMATLCGHASTRMIMKHYSHLDKQVQHMREMAEKATANGEGPRRTKGNPGGRIPETT